MQEPGLDLRDWEGRFRALEPDLEETPREALPEPAALRYRPGKPGL